MFFNNDHLSGHAMSRKKLVDGVTTIGEDGGGDLFLRYLEEVECYQSIIDFQLVNELEQKSACGTLEKYQQSEIVVYKGILLSNEIPETDCDKLSNIMGPYITELLASIDDLFPEIIMDKKDPNRRKQTDKMDSLRIFDQRFWETEAFNKDLFTEAHRFLMHFENRAPVRDAFSQLREKIMQNEQFFCSVKKSEPSEFWSSVFLHYKGDEHLESWYEQSNGKTQVKEIISRGLVIPYGSSSAERSFS